MCLVSCHRHINPETNILVYGLAFHNHNWHCFDDDKARAMTSKAFEHPGSCANVKAYLDLRSLNMANIKLIVEGQDPRVDTVVWISSVSPGRVGSTAAHQRVIYV